MDNMFVWIFSGVYLSVLIVQWCYAWWGEVGVVLVRHHYEELEELAEEEVSYMWFHIHMFVLMFFGMYQVVSFICGVVV